MFWLSYKLTINFLLSKVMKLKILNVKVERKRHTVVPEPTSKPTRNMYGYKEFASAATKVNMECRRSLEGSVQLFPIDIQ